MFEQPCYSSYPQPITTALRSHALQLTVIVIVVIAYIALDRLSTPRLSQGADQSQLEASAGIKAIRTARILLGLLGGLLLLIVWSVDLSAMLIVASTTLTLLGDADNSIEGYISDLNLLHTKLTTEAGELVVYPTNLLPGRPTMVNPKERLEDLDKVVSNANEKLQPPAA